MSPGNASSTVVRCWPNTAWAYLVANGRPVAAWVSTMPRSNRPEQIRTKAIRSRWLRSMPGLHLEHQPGQRGVEVPRDAVGVVPGLRRRGQLDQRVQQPLHPGPGQRGPEQHRGGHPAQEVLLVELGADLAQQRQLVLRGRPELRLGRGDHLGRHHLGARPGWRRPRSG